jgi:NADPH-dependent F420 reductase
VTTDQPTIGILGGTGPAGSGLARRLAHAGHHVLLGSRDLARAAQRVTELEAGGTRTAGTVTGVTNDDAAHADVLVLATVADSVVATATEHAPAFADRVVICMANQLRRDARGFAAVVMPEGSLATTVQRAAPDARVVGAFQNLPAAALLDLDHRLDADVLVCGDDAAAVQAVIDLTATVAGLHPVDAGPLVNAAGIEALTAVLLTVNRARKADHSIKIVAL